MNSSLADARTQPGKSKTVADILTAAADLIEPEGRWTQGAIAKDAEGLTVNAWSRGAVCWCAMGAIRAAAPLLDTTPALMKFSALTFAPGQAFANWNDDPKRTQAEVVAALRAAAAKAAEAGQ